MHKRLQKAKSLITIFCFSISIIMSSTTAFASTTSSTVTTSMPVPRLGGYDQYETAAKIAQQGWPQTANDVVLAAGMTPNLVDALAAGPLATKVKAPILLTDAGDHLNVWAKKEIERLKPAKVYITSGTSVIKSSVLEELKGMGITPVQLGGYDQYETSVNIANELITRGAVVTKVVVAAGWLAPADALSVSSVAAAQGIPILATPRDQLSPKVKAFIDGLQGITDSYIIGGEAVVGPNINNELPGLVQRYFGQTKYDTNLAVLKEFANFLQKDKLYIANGETFVDALAGVPLAAQAYSPIILTNGVLTEAMLDFVKAKLSINIVALGGLSVVSNEVLNRLIEITTLPPVIVTPPVINPAPGGGGGTPVPSTIKVSDLQVITNPSNSLGSFNNNDTIDLSSLSGDIKFIGFSLRVDQACIFEKKSKDLEETLEIDLAADQPNVITISDILGVQSNELFKDGVSLDFLRDYYGSTNKKVEADLIKNGKNMGKVTIYLKFR